MTERSRVIAEDDTFASLLGTRLERVDGDQVEVRLPCRPAQGAERVHGGAISGLVGISATAVSWSMPDPTSEARGATVGFDIHFLQLMVAEDLLAEARVRRRGGSLCTRGALNKQSFLCGAWMHHHFFSVERWKNVRNAKRSDLNKSQERLVQRIPREVTVRDLHGNDVAIATVTCKLSGGSSST